jgi:uncharacterized membrane-anchored protein
MIGALRNRTFAIGAVAAVQLAALAYMVWDREMRVRSGTDVVLEVIPVDPRSLFQGDYVILGYPISTISAGHGAEPQPGQEVFVTVVPGEDGNWRYAGWSHAGSNGSHGVTLKGKVDHVIRAAASDGTQPGEYRVRYGLERFFVPEGKGLGLEDLVRSKRLSAIVAVWRDGSSALKGLVSEGRVLYETGVAAKRPEEVAPMSEYTTPPVIEAPASAPEAVPAEATPAPAPAQAPGQAPEAPAGPPPN